MPKPYSRDLRERVIAACEAGEITRAEIALQFDVSETTVYDWLHRWRVEGTLESRPHAGGHPTRLDRAVLKALVEEHNDRTLAEYADAYAQRTGRRYSIPRICTALQELRLSRKGRRYAPRSTRSPTSPPSA